MGREHPFDSLRTREPCAHEPRAREPRAREPRDASVQLDLDTVLLEFNFGNLGDFAIHIAEQTRTLFDDRDLQTALDEGFGHLQTDVPTADDHGSSAAREGHHRRENRAGIVNRAQSKDVAQVNARQIRLHRGRPSGDQQPVEGFKELAVIPVIQHPHQTSGVIHAQHLVMWFDGDAKRRELCGRVSDQRVQTGNLAGDQVRQAASGVADEVPLFKNGDLEVGVDELGFGGGARRARHAADNDEFHKVS